jgi:hypothetical protein
MTYKDFINKKPKDKNIEGLFFAFNQEQFEEGCKKVGANKDNKVVSIGAGGYILKSKFENFKKIIEDNKKSLKELLRDKKFAEEAFEYELNNTEYCITQDENDALRQLGIEFEFIEKNNLIEVFESCKRKIMEACYGK